MLLAEKKEEKSHAATKHHPAGPNQASLSENHREYRGKRKSSVNQLTYVRLAQILTELEMDG